MSGFSNATDGDFDRVFTTSTQIIDRFVGTRLWTWGHNNQGQLGTNTTTSRNVQGETSSAGTNWAQVSCGYLHTAAIKTDNSLWMWGRNNEGELGDGTTSDKLIPTQTLASSTNWKQVACGQFFTTAIKTDGTLWGWGANGQGQLGDNTLVSKSSPVQVYGGGTNWKQVSCATSHTAAIKTDGTLWSCGYNYYGAMGINNNTPTYCSSPVQTVSGGINWKQVACGNNFTMAIKTDGTLWGWGYNVDGNLGDVSIANRSSPIQTTTGGTNWKLVATNQYQNHTAAIKADGTLWTWGNNALGRLGDGTTTSKSSPIQTSAGGTNWKTVVCGVSQTIAIKTDGTLWACGWAPYGGLGNVASSATMSNIFPSYSSFTNVSTQGYHTAAIGA